MGQSLAGPAGLVALAFAGAACGHPNVAPRGDVGAAAVGGSFDVTATSSLQTSPGQGGTLAFTSHFTLVLDAAGGRGLVGGGGDAQGIHLSSSDGRTFTVTTPFSIRAAAQACNTPLLVRYETLELTVASGVVTGGATGTATVVVPASNSDPDPVVTSAFTALVRAVPDASPPFLVVPPGAAISDPLSPFVLWASEPLPASSTATLVGSDGSRVDLVPQVVDAGEAVVVAFAKPDVVLAPGVGYDVDFSGLADLAGHVAGAGSALRLVSFADAPLVPQDGFESSTAANVGGAAIVRVGPGVLIDGAASAYIGQFNSPNPGGLALQPRLALRLAVPPGAAKLTFSYRQMSQHGDVVAFVELGSVGHAPTGRVPIPSMPATSLTLVSWDKASVDESTVTTMDIPLPTDITDEIVVGVEVAPITCNAGFGTAGLLVDDLRLE